MKKTLLALVVLLPLQGFAAETAKINCTPVAFKNGATIEGTLTLESTDDGAAVAGALNLTLKRVGERYSPETLGNVTVSGAVASVEGLPDSDGVTVPAIAVKVDSANNERIQYMSLNLNLRTVTSDSWVRTADGVKYFANCQVQQ